MKAERYTALSSALQMAAGKRRISESRRSP